METGLIKTTIIPSEVFKPNGLDPVLLGVEEIIKEKNKEEFDVNNEKDREEIKSFAYQITRSKTFVDEKGKKYVAELKKTPKIVDAERKRFREKMDGFRDNFRQPVTDWENAEKARIEKERELEIFNLDHKDALEMDNIFNRERDLAKKEAAFAKVEEEKRQKEEAKRLKKEQKEREERLKKEAAEEAIRITEEAAAKKVAEAIRKEREAVETTKRIELERIEAEKQEKVRLAEVKKQAEVEKQNAIQEAKDKFELQVRLEKEENIRKEAALKVAKEKKAANEKHQAAINNKILNSLVKIGASKDLAKKIIIAAVKGEIKNLTINYY